MAKKMCFLIVSNVRTGSTNSIMSLSSLESIYADFEIKWRRTNLSDGHRDLSPKKPDFYSIISGISSRAQIVGSKFIIDPAGMIFEGDVDLLCSAVSSNIIFIHLTRDYFEICASSILRGHWNSVNFLRDGASASFSAGLPIIEAQLKEKNPFIEDGRMPPHFTPFDQVMLLENLLLNDCIYFQMGSEANIKLVVNYASLNEDLMRVLDFFDLECEEKKHLENVLDNPPLRKLKQLDSNQLYRPKKFKELCDLANDLRDEIVTGVIAPQDLYRNFVREDRCSPYIYHEEFQALKAGFLRLTN